MKIKLWKNRASFMCPGCKKIHSVLIDDGARGWAFNGDIDAPTFTPSILVTTPANPEASEDFAEYRKEQICHSFITDGKIQFLTDCTHALAGKTVELPLWQEAPR